MKKPKIYKRKRCVYCGRYFMPMHARTKYCKPAHRLAEHRYQRALREGTLHHSTEIKKKGHEVIINEQA
jgi:uncharacterized OB-fold protein